MGIRTDIQHAVRDFSGLLKQFKFFFWIHDLNIPGSWLVPVPGKILLPLSGPQVQLNVDAKILNPLLNFQGSLLQFTAEKDYCFAFLPWRLAQYHKYYESWSLGRGLSYFQLNSSESCVQSAWCPLLKWRLNLWSLGKQLRATAIADSRGRKGTES